MVADVGPGEHEAPGPRRSSLSATYVVATGLLAAGAFAACLTLLGWHAAVGSTPELAGIVSACLLVAEVRPPRWLRFGDAPVSVSWVFAFALVLMGASIGAMVVTAVAAMLGAAGIRAPMRAVLFNGFQVLVSLATAPLILVAGGALHDLWPGHSPSGARWVVSVLAAAAALYLTNGLLVAGAISTSGRGPFVPTLLDGLRVNVAGDGVLMSLAPGIVVVGQRSLVLLPFSALTGFGLYGLARVATSRHAAALRDPLTGVANRRGFGEAAARLFERRDDGLRFVAAVVDLDGFKPVNDRYGHAAGDAVLMAVARRLEACAPDDAVVGRLGGDEFAVAWLARSADEADAVADSLRRSLAGPVVAAGVELTASGSVGVSLDAPDVSTALREADEAMYRAKVARVEARAA